jgi:hypothetical protein
MGKPVAASDLLFACEVLADAEELLASEVKILGSGLFT